MNVRLFVIRKLGTNQFWNNSPEHGCGWSIEHPKQSFSLSELTKEIRLLIEKGWFEDCEILQLSICGLSARTKQQ